MSETREVRCDACEADITHTGNSVDYRLRIHSQGLGAPGPGFVTDMMIYDPLPNDLHFCGWGCLDTWFARRKANQPAREGA